MNSKSESKSTEVNLFDVSLVSREDVLNALAEEQPGTYFTEEYFRETFFERRKRQNLDSIAITRGIGVSACCEIFGHVPPVSSITFLVSAELVTLDIACFAPCGIKSVTVSLGRLQGLPPGKKGIEPYDELSRVINVNQPKPIFPNPDAFSAPVVRQSFPIAFSELVFEDNGATAERRGWLVEIIDNCGKVTNDHGPLP